MITEGGLTVIVGIIAFSYLPASPATAWFLTDPEKAAARSRSLRDSSNSVGTKFNLRDCFQISKDWKFGLGNFGGIISAATFRVEYAPKYVPTLIATCCFNVCAIFAALGLGLWIKVENRRRNAEQGVQLEAKDVDTSELTGGEKSPRFRYFT